MSVEELVSAVWANDVARTRAVLDAHPELGKRLNDALPGLHFESTVLAPAVQHQNRDLVELLLSRGADINVKSQWWAGGFGMLDLADPAFVPFLLERGAILTAYSASRLGFLKELEIIVRADPHSIHMRGGDGQTPLHVAATVEIAGFLLDRGADIDALDVDHESSPAQYAIRERPLVARFLVARGAHADILLASALGDLVRVRALLDANPSRVETTVDATWFPMQNPRAGGTIYNWTLGGFTTAHVVAREFGRDEVYRFLIERTRPAFRLALACEFGDIEERAALLRQHTDIAHELVDSDKRRLCAMAERNNTRAAEMMLDAGWPSDAGAGEAATALHWAAFHGNASLVRTLLRHSAPVAARDPEYHGTPLDWAEHGSRNSWYCKTGDYVGTRKALIDAGATISK